MSIIPIFYQEQKCKNPNIKEKAHSTALSNLKEGVNLIVFNKQWKKNRLLAKLPERGKCEIVQAMLT